MALHATQTVNEPDTSPSGQAPAPEPHIRRRLRALRWQLAPARILGVGATIASLWVLGRQLGAPQLYSAANMLTLGAALVLFHVAPYVMRRLLDCPSERLVTPGSQSVTGLYTDRELLAILARACARVPRYMRRARLFVAERWELQAWTYLGLLWPTWGSRPGIRVTSGALHYLRPDELEALLLHEMGHHLPSHRLGVPLGWLLFDLALASTLLAARSDARWEIGHAATLFMMVRTLVAYVVGHSFGTVAQFVEHACDLFAASCVGVAPIANVLLKTGEENELAEAVLALSASRLLHAEDIDMEELMMAFAEVRPEGRIFHANLFRHAQAVVDKLVDRAALAARKGENVELRAFLRERAAHKSLRIRWRAFDADGNGVLSRDELDRLAKELRKHPERVLAVSSTEYEPSTHPSCRERLLALVSPAE